MQGGLFFEKAFTISVTDVNKTPTDIALSTSSVAEKPASTPRSAPSAPPIRTRQHLHLHAW